jgi:hypothetical protein
VTADSINPRLKARLVASFEFPELAPRIANELEGLDPSEAPPPDNTANNSHARQR